MTEAQKIADYIKATLDLKAEYELKEFISDEFHYSSLPLAMIDAIFSIRARYTTTKQVVQRYCDTYKIVQFYNERPEKGFIEHTTSDYIRNADNEGGCDKLAEKALNIQKIAGRLKAQNVYDWAVIFKRHGIETLNDFNAKMTASIEAELKRVKGQGGDAVAIPYLYMLCGNMDKCKPDTHLLHYLSDATKRTVIASEAQELMTQVAKELCKDNAYITVRLLDYTIWKNQSNGGNKNMKKCPICDLNYIRNDEQACVVCCKPQTVEPTAQATRVTPTVLFKESGVGNAKGKITEVMVARGYEYGKQYALGQLRFSDAVSKIILESGMNEASAYRTVNNMNGLFEGKKYTSTMSKSMTLWLLEAIRTEFGEDKFQTALNAVEQHLDYYEALPRGSEQREIRDYVNHHKKK